MPQQASGQITKIFKSNMCKDAFNWKLVPSSHKDGYFDDFKKNYRWPQVEETTIKNAFMKLGSIRYSDMVSTFKKNWNGPQKKKPDCIGEADWAQWVQHFNKDEVKSKSEINSKNRLTEKEDGSSKHTGGSKSAVAHLKSMEDYQREIEVASSERELTVEEENKIYLRDAGVKKQRAYGLGSVGSLLASDDGTSNESNTQMVEDNLSEFKNEMLEKLNEKKRVGGIVRRENEWEE